MALEGSGRLGVVQTYGRIERRNARMALVLACFASLGGCLRCGARTETEEWLPESEFPDRLVAARCVQTDDCCRDAGYASSSSECSSIARANLLRQIADAQASGATYDPVAAAECVATFATACADLESIKTVRNDGPCNRVYVRAENPLGSACLSDWACPTGSGCGSYLSGNTTVRACMTVTLRDEGETCAAATPSHGEGCTPPLRCVGGTCQHPPELGEPCNGRGADDCAPGSVCDRLGTHRCIVPPKAPGEPCTAPEQCEGTGASRDAVCSRGGSLAGPVACTR